MKILQIDSFTQEPFSGNPAAVCIVDRPLDDTWMQKLAAEMNLSETAFVTRQDDGFAIRWFTPRVEVDLCGHATLASAHALWEEGIAPANRSITFQSASGELTATKEEGLITLDFPAWTGKPAELSRELAEILGSEPLGVYVSNNINMVELASEQSVRHFEPNLPRIALLPVDNLVITARASSDEFDFVTRCFCPNEGIDEDPVTGSIHCYLGPYWQERLGKDTLTAFQASNRGGFIRVRCSGDRVHLGGRAVTIFRGELAI